MVIPQTDIRIVKVPIEIDNKNQLTFNNIEEQKNYFESLEHIEKTNTQYQRKDGVIRFPGIIDDLLTFNYVMFKNENYSEKWFYAFITDMKYINDGMTEISIETDVFQTWQFDFNLKKSFIEREHVSNDQVGLHTVPENLEMGEYIVDQIIKCDELNELKYIIQVTEWTNSQDSGNKPLATNFGGVYMAGRSLYLFNYNRSC